MKIRSIATTCCAVGVALNTMLVLKSPLGGWIELLAPAASFVSSESSPNVNNVTATTSVGDEFLVSSRKLGERNKVGESSSRSSPRLHYGPWDASVTKTSVEEENSSLLPSTRNISILVELTGELGNQLNYIAHGRAIQTMLWQDHGVASHLVLRRNSNEEKYQRTQRQIKRCFPNLRSLNFHGPGSSSITSQKTLDRIQSTFLGPDQSKSLFMNVGSSFDTTQKSIHNLVDLLEKREWGLFLDAATAVGSVGSANSSSTITRSDLLSKQHGVSFPFLRTHSMINREFMDKFYDDFRDFFQFDDEACCATADLPDPDVAVFHFRNFVGELKQGKNTGLEELSAHKVATEIFAHSQPSSNNNSTQKKSIAIATRFPGRKASQEYFDTLLKEGFDVQWLTVKDGSSSSPPSAMHDFCAMRRTTELVGMVRSTFAVWAALLGNANGTALLYSVDSTWTRKKYTMKGKPIFRTYNWTHPELQRRIHFELHKAEK